MLGGKDSFPGQMSLGGVEKDRVIQNQGGRRGVAEQVVQAAAQAVSVA